MRRETRWILLIISGVAATVSAYTQTGGGCILLDRAEYERIAVAPMPPRLRSVLPARYFLATPPVGDQSTQGSCVAWATAYAAVGVLAMQKYGREEQFSPAFVYNQIQKVQNEDTCKGTAVEDALRLLEAQGVCPMWQMPYDESACDRQPTAKMHGAALSNRVRWGRQASDTDVEEYKRRVVGGQPVVISVNCTSEYTIHAGGDGYWSEHGIPNDSLNHAMCVVGYDDNKVQAGKRGFLKVMNSIGDSRGDGGFLWIAYDLVREGLIDESYAVYGISADVRLEGDDQLCSSSSYRLENGAPEWGVRWEVGSKARIISTSGHTMEAKSVRNELQDRDGKTFVTARVFVPGEWACEAEISRGVWAGGPKVTLCCYEEGEDGGGVSEQCGPSVHLRLQLGIPSGLSTTVWWLVEQGDDLRLVGNSNPKVAGVQMYETSIIPYAQSPGGTMVSVASSNTCGDSYGHVGISVSRARRSPHRPIVDMLSATR